MSFRDLDEIADTVYRRSAARIEELRAANQRVAAENRALIEQSAQRIRTRLQQAEARNHEAAQVSKTDQQEPWTGREQESSTSQPDHRAQPEQLEELRQQREAVARAAANRQNRNVVTPIDDDGDDEAEYYRRNSWLV
ncbi:hypothetical protein [Nocardia grenadensis]|uniref:hypothetical protein n=1 Tax=Nocardia grenadensis TaxID=931537 RepID=UPI0007A45167|nr:hypothetical protein [Nocardia grenadensis]